MMPLNLANPGETQIIRKIGGNPEVKKHLENLGFTVGGEIRIVSSLGGNLIVQVKESRVAVSDELARKIMIFEGGMHGENTQRCQDRRNCNCCETARRGSRKETHHGYGANQAHTRLCKKGSSTWGSHRSDSKKL